MCEEEKAAVTEAAAEFPFFNPAIRGGESRNRRVVVALDPLHLHGRRRRLRRRRRRSASSLLNTTSYLLPYLLSFFFSPSYAEYFFGEPPRTRCVQISFPPELMRSLSLLRLAPTVRTAFSLREQHARTHARYAVRCTRARTLLGFLRTTHRHQNCTVTGRATQTQEVCDARTSDLHSHQDYTQTLEVHKRTPEDL